MRRRLLIGLAGATLLAVAPGLTAQSVKPSYKPYVEFGTEDSGERVAAKRAYNEAAQRYNQALYEYHVTLERHDRLVETHNDPAADPAEKKRARDQAQALRPRLTELRREVTTRAAAVDQAGRRAAAVGVSTP